MFMPCLWKIHLFLLLWTSVAKSQDCNNPPSVGNTTIFTSSTVEYSLARYICNPGLYTLNFTSIVCFLGKWRSFDDGLPFPPDDLSESSLLIPPTCVKPAEGCGNPPLLINGAYESERQINHVHEVDQTITYSCVDGFQLWAPVGEKSICLIGNKWSLETSAFPRCEPDCGNPPQAANATIRVSSTTEGSVAHYICNQGLSTSDMTTSTCRRKGNKVYWDLNKLPLCRFPEQGCGNPPTIQNGYLLNIPSSNEGDILTYTCYDGYGLIDPDGPNVICRSSWITESGSKIFPKCRPVCGALPTEPSGGSFLLDKVQGYKEGMSFSHGVEVRFSCKPEYILVRNATLTCIEGNWNWTINGEIGKPPLCYQDCGPTPLEENAVTNALSTLQTWTVDYACEPGFSNFRTKTIVCDSDGKWVPLFPKDDESLSACKLPPPPGCGNPPPLKNGRFYEQQAYYNESDTVTYVCDYGFTIDNPSGSTSRCVAGNMWSLRQGSIEFPTCNSGCAQLPPGSRHGLEIVAQSSINPYGFDFRSVITYKCKNGFSLIGSPTLSCDNGVWTPELPSCVKVCYPPPPVANTNIKALSNTEGSSYEYVCKPGHSTNDSTITTCLGNGSWSLVKPPICGIPQSGCGNPLPLQNGNYSGKYPFNEGASITYHCHGDLEMVAPYGSVSICQAGNKWSLEMESVNEFPVCRSVCRSKPPSPGKNVLILSEPTLNKNGFYSLESTIVFACEESFSLAGSPTITCTGYGWLPDRTSAVCFKTLPNIFIPVTYTFLGPRRALDAIDINNTRDPQNDRNITNITSICGYPGFCVGSTPDIRYECFDKPLLECQACGMEKAGPFLFFVLLFGLAIFVCNALVIWVGCKRLNRGKSSKMDICKTSLAFADILTGIQILVVVSFNFSWSMTLTAVELNDRQWKLQSSPQAYVGAMFLILTFSSSLYHLVYMGGERLYAIVKPIHYKWQLNSAVYLGLGVVWSLALLSATVPAWFPDQFIYTYFAPTFLYYPALTEVSSNLDYSAATVVMTIFYVVPFAILTASCLFTAAFVYKADKQKKINANDQSSPTSKRMRKRKLSVLKTLAIMQFGFTITLIPIVVVGSLFYAGQLTCDNIAPPFLVCFYLSMTNSLVNVIVYSARDGEFRNEIVDIFRPGYLKQLNVQSGVEKPKKDHITSNKANSSETDQPKTSKETTL
ncbi:sushi, von Willebrand factor type A, EGF and pentraxin domain-containing protein 1-like isoform X1 [Clavelina lepadiformis]|uniref:sushi, von Willebrand factor type A, EGF and pentraxin domain-containing protein 1-like isoform X1 n=1 Tax=Clavelina lepadiformis TaxID=159417 RepID=UPI004042E4D7